MPLPNCDSTAAGLPYWTTIQSRGNDGEVEIRIRWVWDGTSVHEAAGGTGCDGPIVNDGSGQNRWAISYHNNGTNTYDVVTRGKNGSNPRTLRLNPGASGTFTAQQASNQGYSNISDLDDLTFNLV